MRLIKHIINSLLLFFCSLAIADNNASLLLHAARVFDGYQMQTKTSVLINNGKIVQIAPRSSIKADSAKAIDLGDATILPGFIELHAHLGFRQIPAATVLRHGITTLRDVGGDVHQPYGGDGQLRVLTSGQILTAPQGYPIPQMGAEHLAIPISTETQARDTVKQLIAKGAVIIKVALEPGGEHGAPWQHGHHAHQHKAMPLLSEKIVKAIVAQAHQQQRKVTAHVAETKGVKIALHAGIDEWAHMPCEIISVPLLKQAVVQGVKIVGTLDTLSHCHGITDNTHNWTKLGGELLYGAEIAHADIPWGIDAQELQLMQHLGHLTPLAVLSTATAKAGQHLNIPLLGTLQANAPADLIAVQGDPSKNFKILEYPDLVISSGKIMLNNFNDKPEVK